MIAVLVLVFVAVALAASAFVVLPLIRRSREDDARKPLLAIGAGLGVAAMGLVFYVVAGHAPGGAELAPRRFERGLSAS